MPCRVDAQNGASRGGAEQGLEPIPGVVRFARIAAGHPGLLCEVGQEGTVPGDHRVHGRRDQGGDGDHDGHLAPFERGVIGRANEEHRDEEGQIHAEEPDQKVEAASVEREPDDGQEVHHHQTGVGTTLGVPDDGDDGDIADRDDEPGPVGQSFPGQEEGGGHEAEEDDAGDGDLPAGVVGEGDEGDQDGADGHQGEDRQPDPHGAREPDREGGPRQLWVAAPFGVGLGLERLAHRVRER